MLNVLKSFPQLLQTPSGWLEALQNGLGTTLAERVLRVLTLATLALGLFLRSRGMLFGEALPFWHDESQWAVFLLTEPLTNLFIRPVGFMALTKGLVAVFGASEWVFRLLPWLGGVGLVLLAPAFARRVVRGHASRFLLVCVLALHPTLIDLTREFKPYALGVTIHAAVLIAALDYVAHRRTRDLTLALSLGFAGVLFAQDVIFLYPPLFSLVAFVAYRDRCWAHLLRIGAAAVATLALLVTLFLMIWSGLDKEGERTYWAHRYDVFHLEESGTSRAAWLARKTGEVLAFPGLRRQHWDGVVANEAEPTVKERVDSWLWIALGGLGVAALVRRRRWAELLLLAGPVLVLVAFNVIGRWPYGAFRTNLFLLAYAAPLAAAAFELVAALSAGLFAALPGMTLVLAPFFFVNQHFHASKESFSQQSYISHAVEYLLNAHGRGYRGGRELVILDTHSCAGFKFYTRYHPAFVERWSSVEDQFRLKCGKKVRRMLLHARDGLERDERVWVIGSSKASLRDLEGRIRGLAVVSKVRLADQHIVMGFESR